MENNKKDVLEIISNEKFFDDNSLNLYNKAYIDSKKETLICSGEILRQLDELYNEKYLYMKKQSFVSLIILKMLKIFKENDIKIDDIREFSDDTHNYSINYYIPKEIIEELNKYVKECKPLKKYNISNIIFYLFMLCSD